MNSFLITGGLGFIGFHIAKELIKNQEHNIIVYDALKFFIPESENPDHCIQYRRSQIEKAQIIHGDCLNNNLLFATLKKNKPEVIFHLSSLPLPKYAENHKEEAWDNICQSTINLLENISKIDNYKPQIIYASTSMVYGDFYRDHNKIVPALENNDCNPQNVYGRYKLDTENLLIEFCLKHNIPYTIIRPTAVYGPSDCNHRITEIFIRNALDSKPLHLDNGGIHELDFTYIADVVQGFILTAGHPNAYNEIFNISYGQGRKIAELADIISGLIPGVKMISRETSSIGPLRGALNIEKAKNILGYSPKYSLEEGIKKYITFVKNIDI